MSYDNPRIKNLSMSLLDIIVDFSEGNPGAASTITKIISEYTKIDPESAFKEMSPLFDLDNLDFYGPKIWLFYKDVCGCSVLNCCILFRAIQLGYYPSKDLENAVNKMAIGRYEKFEVDFEGLLKRIQERLPNFGTFGEKAA